MTTLDITKRSQTIIETTFVMVKPDGGGNGRTGGG